MSQPIAVIDTSVIIWLTAAIKADNADALAKRNVVESTLKHLEDSGVQFRIPTPVIAELSRDGIGSKVARKLASSLATYTRLEPLTVLAADYAGQMREKALKAVPREKPRGAISYDALIAGIAHNLEATWLLTTDPDDMTRCLVVIASPVKVVNAIDGLPGVQLSLRR